MQSRLGISRVPFIEVRVLFFNILVEGAGARALQETIPADRGDARGLLRVEALPRSSVVLGMVSLCWEAERAKLARAPHEVLPGGAAGR